MVDIENPRVLDFFAGSGTTAHAVAELNKEDGGSRESILITNNEGGGKDPAEGISRKITQKRVIRALTGENWANGKDYPLLPGDFSFFLL